MNDTKIFLEKRLFSGSIGAYVQRREDGKRHHGVIKWEEITPDMQGIPMDPSFEFSKKEAQHLIDELWDCGLRPTQGSGSAGSLVATEKHLNDMRKIVSSKLKVEL